MNYFPPNIAPSPSLRRILEMPSPVYVCAPMIGVRAERIYLHGLDIASSPELAEECRILQERLYPLLTPFRCPESHREAVNDLLDVVNASVRNPMDTAALDAKGMLLTIATRDTPERAFTPNAHIECIRTFSFFPALADIISVLDRQVQPIRDTISRLKIIRIKAEMA